MKAVRSALGLVVNLIIIQRVNEWLSEVLTGVFSSWRTSGSRTVRREAWQMEPARSTTTLKTRRALMARWGYVCRNQAGLTLIPHQAPEELESHWAFNSPSCQLIKSVFSVYLALVSYLPFLPFVIEICGIFSVSSFIRPCVLCRPSLLCKAHLLSALTLLTVLELLSWSGSPHRGTGLRRMRRSRKRHIFK